MEIVSIFVKWIGSLIVSFVILSIPALTVLSAIYDWGFIIGGMLGTLLGCELIALSYYIVEKANNQK